MTRKHRRYAFFVLLTLLIMLVLVLLLQVFELKAFKGNIAMLWPKGAIAIKERNLLFVVQILMLIIVLPVFFLFFVFSWIYRATNLRTNYAPDWEHSTTADVVWWGLPCAIVLVIGILTWVYTYKLDPYKPIVSEKKPVTIQAVALQWKWLFIYPEENIASMNFIQFPEKTPIRFIITADAPMNSLWIPELGGQIYAMPKMRTELNLIADVPGEFRGCSANISGIGFAGMHFIAKASSDAEYEEWLKTAKQSQHPLNFKVYEELAKPSQNDPVTTYVLKENDLFDQIIMKYMMPPGASHQK